MRIIVLYRNSFGHHDVIFLLQKTDFCQPSENDVELNVEH